MSSNRIYSLTQTNGSLTRTTTFNGSSAGNIQNIIDNAGGSMTVNDQADDGNLTTIINPDGAETDITYSGSKATAVSQQNSSGAGTSITRFEYDSGQTLVADPTTNQSTAISAVPHTTYTLTTDGSNLVSKTTDPNGHARSATYTSLGQIQTQTAAAGGTTTYTYGANSGESLTSLASPGGATGTAAYGNTGSNAYLPSSTTDSAGNATKYTYNGAGNQLTTAQGTSGPQATVTYNSNLNGTPVASASPGAASGVQTSYGYDGTADLTSITPVTGSSLGSRAYTWDGFGRLSTETNGRGGTISYTYDNLDRIMKVSYSDGSTAVSYTYDREGHVKTRSDGSGTTTYSYDALGHLLSVSSTSGGGTFSYTYDLDGAEASQTDAHGTTTYSYDPAHQLSYMLYPQGSGTAEIAFAYDNSGRRTDEWLQTNSTQSVWGGHTHTTYDSSGRVTNVTAQQGPATAPTTVFNQTYCYEAGTTPSGGCTLSSSADRSNIQWMSDAVRGETHTYTYDGNARLIKDTITSSSNPRTLSFSYDAAGNRLTSSTTGTSPSSQTLTYNNANQVSSSGYTYDGSGDRTAGQGVTASFDIAGRMTSSTSGGQTTTFTYAGTNQDELVKEAISGGATYNYAYGATDQNGLPGIAGVTYTPAGGSAQNAYVLHDNTGFPVMLTTSTGSVGMYIYDGHDNPVGLITNFASLAYLLYFDPYGGTSIAQNSGGTGYTQNPYGWEAGLQAHGSQLIKFGARWYDPYNGSWIQQDYLNAPLDPSNADRYAYAADDPIDHADPAGNSCAGDIFFAGLSAIGEVASTASLFGDGLDGGLTAGLTIAGFEASTGGLVGSIGAAVNDC